MSISQIRSKSPPGFCLVIIIGRFAASHHQAARGLQTRALRRPGPGRRDVRLTVPGIVSMSSVLERAADARVAELLGQADRSRRNTSKRQMLQQSADDLQRPPHPFSQSPSRRAPSQRVVVARPTAHIDPVVRYAFARFDTERNGTIAVEDLRAALEYLGMPAEKLRAAAAVLRVYTVEPDLTLDMFAHVVLEVRKYGTSFISMEVRSAFEAFDVDRDGAIDAKELQGALGKLGKQRQALTA